jgi:hypothetical protein
MWLKDVAEKPAGAGSIAGAIAGVIVAIITPLVSSCNFERNVAMEAVKGAKSADDMKARLDILCSRQFISGSNCAEKK